MYQGHCTDGSSVQKHSAGGLYPYIIFAKQCGDKLRYGVIAPNGDEVLLSTHDFAVQFALTLKNGTQQKRISH
jgi:hypothetical protein